MSSLAARCIVALKKDLRGFIDTLRECLDDWVIEFWRAHCQRSEDTLSRGVQRKTRRSPSVVQTLWVHFMKACLPSTFARSPGCNPHSTELLLLSCLLRSHRFRAS